MFCMCLPTSLCADKSINNSLCLIHKRALRIDTSRVSVYYFFQTKYDNTL